MTMPEFNERNSKIWARLGSCGAFGLASLELPAVNDKTVILTADLRFFSGLERFASAFPDRLYNFGIAEQNMLGAAGGMASEGFVPFAVSYAAFSSLRCADQVKVCMAYMRQNIKLVGLTSGFAVGILGPTHYCLEDIALMRALPNITIIAPADCAEIIKATLAVANYPGPVYLRLTGAQNMQIVHNNDFDFQIGKAIQLRDGQDLAIIACGTMVASSLKAAAILAEEGIAAQVWNMHTIRPLDLDALRKAAGTKLIVSVEEHALVGGLGDAISENLDPFVHPPLIRMGVSGPYPHAGNYGWLLEQTGLTPENIAARTRTAFGAVKNGHQ